MPLYDYLCENEKCKIKHFDKQVKLADQKKPVKCPKCGKKAFLDITNPIHYKHGSWSRW